VEDNFKNMTTTTTIKDIKELCSLYGLNFKRGDFSKGARFKVLLELNEEVVAWPCQTLSQCKEAIYQADYLRHHQVI